MSIGDKELGAIYNIGILLSGGFGLDAAGIIPGAGFSQG